MITAASMQRLSKTTHFLHCDGFQDIRVLQHLCARVTGAEGKTYFVDEKEVMEKRLRDALVD